MTANASIPIQIRFLPHGADLPLPDYQSEHAAGMDLYAAVEKSQPVKLAPGTVALIPCGFAMALPVGYEGQVRPRSGLAVKHGVTVVNSPGTIDADYRGEVKVALVNLGPQPVSITKGMRIAQLIIQTVPRAAWQVVDTLESTSRGAGGFGHTGK